MNIATGQAAGATYLLPRGRGGREIPFRDIPAAMAAPAGRRRPRRIHGAFAGRGRGRRRPLQPSGRGPALGALDAADMAGISRPPGARGRAARRGDASGCAGRGRHVERGPSPRARRIPHGRVGRRRRRIDADLFLDCTGEAALLAGGVLGLAWQPWRQEWFPCDRLLTVATHRDEDSAALLTRRARHPAGWSWESIATRASAHHGLFYSSTHLADAEATRALADRMWWPRRQRFDDSAAGDASDSGRVTWWRWDMRPAASSRCAAPS